MKEKHVRSALKGITWRITGTIDTIVIVYILTGKLNLAMSIGGVEVITKIVLYYLHERIWFRIKWGKKHEN
mgnify:CR=1 FL=1